MMTSINSRAVRYEVKRMSNDYAPAAMMPNGYWYISGEPGYYMTEESAREAVVRLTIASGRRP